MCKHCSLVHQNQVFFLACLFIAASCACRSACSAFACSSLARSVSSCCSFCCCGAAFCLAVANKLRCFPLENPLWGNQCCCCWGARRRPGGLSTLMTCSDQKPLFTPIPHNPAKSKKICASVQGTAPFMHVTLDHASKAYKNCMLTVLLSFCFAIKLQSKMPYCTYITAYHKNFLTPSGSIATYRTL